MTIPISFWGTRGSRPTIAAANGTGTRFGGNTSCASVRTPSGDLIILDAGTGLADLGNSLGPDPVKALILVTHTHWDHIQGLPFFQPLFEAGQRVDIRGPHSAEGRFVDSLRTQMSPDFFPVRFDDCDADVVVSELGDCTPFEWGGVRITPHLLNHPAPTFGYRLDVASSSLVYATDCELRPLLDEADRRSTGSRFSAMVDWMANADLLIHDAQYTESEYLAKRGWGHSSVGDALRAKRDAGIAALALWHHDPSHSDGDIERIVEECAAIDPTVFAAADGSTVNVGEKSSIAR